MERENGINFLKFIGVFIFENKLQYTNYQLELNVILVILSLSPLT